MYGFLCLDIQVLEPMILILIFQPLPFLINLLYFAFCVLKVSYYEFIFQVILLPALFYDVSL